MYHVHTAELPGVRLRYVQQGDTGPALLLIHGITGTLDTYLPLIGQFSDMARVYALDLRGHGHSSHTDNYRVQDYGHDVVAFIEQVIGEPAVIVGHSLGALIAAWTAANAPSAVRGILLEDPPMYMATRERYRDTAFYPGFIDTRDALIAHAARDGTVDELAAQIGAAPVNNEQTFLEFAGPDIVRARAEHMHRLDPRTLDVATDGTVMDGFDPDIDLPRITCPVHLQAGIEALGGALTAADVQRMVSLIPHGTLTIFEDTGHGIHDQRPQEYVREVRRFIESLS